MGSVCLIPELGFVADTLVPTDSQAGLPTAGDVVTPHGVWGKCHDEKKCLPLFGRLITKRTVVTPLAIHIS